MDTPVYVVAVPHGSGLTEREAFQMVTDRIKDKAVTQELHIRALCHRMYTELNGTRDYQTVEEFEQRAQSLWHRLNELTGLIAAHGTIVDAMLAARKQEPTTAAEQKAAA